MLTRVIIVTSLKGGVGKTTITANLAMTLARKGHKVVAIDCDLESRCLDMVLGLENDSLYNISDILSGRCSISDAQINDSRCEDLAFISAPASIIDKDSEEFANVFNAENVAKLIEDLSECFDYILFDLPAHPDGWYELLLKHTDYALVVAMHTAVSIRSAEKTAMTIGDVCERIGSAEVDFDEDGDMIESKLKVRLIINGFRGRDASDGIRSGVYDIISKTSVKLLGVVPYDETMAVAQESGKLAYQVQKNGASSNTAFNNIALRLDGAKVPLLSGLMDKRKRRKVL